MNENIIYNINLLQLELYHIRTIHDYLGGLKGMKVSDLETVLKELELAHGRIDHLEKWLEDNKVVQPKYHSVALIALYGLVGLYVILRIIYGW